MEARAVATVMSAGVAMSATKAAAFFRVDRHTLVDAFRAGRVRGSEIHRLGLGPDGVGYVFDSVELAADLECLTCRHPGCGRLALGPSGGCEAHGHLYLGARALGVERPDIGPKISRAKLGHSPGEDARDNMSLARSRYYATPAGKRRKTEQSEELRKAWETGEGAPPAILALRSKGVTRSRYHGRWNGHLGAADGIEHGRAKGGRKPRSTPEEQQQMLRLHNDGNSNRSIAREVFGDERFYKRVERFLKR